MDLSEYNKDGKGWAVVSGASEGIGKEYCLQLVRQGFNVAICSRSQEKMDLVVQEANLINPDVIVKPHKIDFATRTDNYKPLTCISGRGKDIYQNLRIMVNNVGTAGSGLFLSQDPHKI